MASPQCTDVIEIEESDSFFAVMTDGSGLVLSMQNEQLGRLPPVGLDCSDRSAAMTTPLRMAVANYPRGSLSVYDCAAGRLVWRVRKLPSPMELACAADDRLFLVQYSGACTEFGGAKGNVVRVIPGVISVMASRSHQYVGLLRGTPKTTRNVLELYEGTLESPVAVLEPVSSGISLYAVNRAGIIFTSYDDDVIWCWTREHGVRWTVKCPSTCYFACIAMQPDPEGVFTIIVSRERGFVPLAVEYDLATGKERRSRRFEKGGVVPVCGGRYTVWRDGYLDFETLEYVPAKWGA